MTSSGSPGGFTDVFERRLPGGFKDVFGPKVPGGKRTLEVPVRPDRWSVDSDDAFRTWARSRRGSTSGGSPLSSTGSSAEALIEGLNVPGFRRGVPNLHGFRRGVSNLLPIRQPIPPTKPLPPTPASPWKGRLKKAATSTFKAVGTHVPALVAG